MLFNSFEFFIFYGIFLLLYFSLPRRWGPALLLAASYVFYMSWEPVYVLFLVLTTLVDYTSARAMDATEVAAKRRLAMIAALLINVGILAFLKYGNFVAENVVALAALFGVTLTWHRTNISLPAGISFYTFQSIGYVLDVYFRRARAERSLFYYAQYVAFFPQLVAGPIERVTHMMGQYKRQHPFRYENVPPALWLIGWGLFKKMCIADQVSPFVNAIYEHPADFSGSYTLLATVLFGLQIYCDFSGYSDIARGVARFFDFDLMINFRQPYFSGSLSAFWQRWHISLSTWFRDYLYKPLGGSHVPMAQSLRNILVVFVVSGVWHGASWTFVVWGLLHGIGLCIERLFRQVTGLKRQVSSRLAGWMRGTVGWILTMALVFAGWVFFRASSFESAAAVFASLGHFTALDYNVFKVVHLASFEIIITCLALPTMIAIEMVIERGTVIAASQIVGRFGAIACGVALAYSILLFGVFGHQQFIYFQF